MSDPINLNGAIADVIATSRERNRPIAFAYTRADGTPSVSYRGGVYVFAPDVLALWVRSKDSGAATAIASNPKVSLAYWTPDATGVTYLIIEGRARLAPEHDEQVWNDVTDLESAADPERKGAAILIDVDKVDGWEMQSGAFLQERQ